jgi:hypothetical protein
MYRVRKLILYQMRRLAPLGDKMNKKIAITHIHCNALQSLRISSTDLP